MMCVAAAVPSLTRGLLMSDATRKPRDLVRVTPYLNPVGHARCKVELSGGQIVPLHELTRPELANAARMVFPELPGNAWLRFTTDEVQTMIRENDHDKAAAAVAAKGSPGKKAPVKQSHQALHDTGECFCDYPATGHAPAEAPAGLDPEEAALLEAFRAAKKPGIDLAELKALVASEVEHQVIELGVTRIEIVSQDAKNELPKIHHKALPELCVVAGQRLNVFLVGPAGSGKSTLAHNVAVALGVPFYALSLGPTTPTSKLFGYMDAQGRYVRTPFREAYENGGVILLDELDNGHPGLVTEINQATANGYCAFADGMVQRHADTIIMATGNTFGRGPDRLFVGRNILDAATLDRFVTIEILIDERLEGQLARAFKTDDNGQAVESWIGYVQQVRRRIEDQKLPVVCSPRSTIDGARLIAAGLTQDRVKEIRLFAGIGPDVRAKIS